jgi:hypothetical protein
MRSESQRQCRIVNNIDVHKIVVLGVRIVSCHVFKDTEAAQSYHPSRATCDSPVSTAGNVSRFSPVI